MKPRFSLLLSAVVLLFCMVLPAGTCAGQSWEENRNNLEKAVSGMLDAVGRGLESLGSEIQQGVNSMQKKLDDRDDTRCISRRQELESLVRVSVLTVEQPADGQVRIMVGIHNDGDRAVRLVDLAAAQNVMLIDAAGFAHDPVIADSFPRQLDVPPRAARKLCLEFARVDRAPERLRLYGADVPLPAAPAVHTL